MKSEFKAKFLQHINQKRQDKGFTLIELLVVIIIIGILSAIALPSFLNQANKAKESEAKQYTGSMNRAQQAKYAELGDFASNVDVLGLGIKTQTTNFTYGVIWTAKASTVANEGVPVVANLKPYTGQVYTLQSATTSETTTVAILCVNNTTATAAITGIGTDCGTTAVAVTK